MTLQEKIAALPEWPKGGVPKHGSLAAVIALEHGAALARLALAREWIEEREHDVWCEWLQWSVKDNAPCTCGRDALLKALEGP